MQIELLADRPEFVPTLAEWHFREWAYLRPGDSVANRIRLLHERSGRRELPITFVASFGAELLGSAMLIHHEMDTRPQYTPWLAGVFVAPARRQRDIGRALTQHGRQGNDDHVGRQAITTVGRDDECRAPLAAGLVGNLDPVKVAASGMRLRRAHSSHPRRSISSPREAQSSSSRRSAALSEL